MVYFPPFFRDKRMRTIFRLISRKKGGKLIFRQGGGRKAEGGFYPRPILCVCVMIIRVLLCRVSMPKARNRGLVLLPLSQPDENPGNFPNHGNDQM